MRRINAVANRTNPAENAVASRATRTLSGAVHGPARSAERSRAHRKRALEGVHSTRSTAAPIPWCARRCRETSRLSRKSETVSMASQYGQSTSRVGAEKIRSRPRSITLIRKIAARFEVIEYPKIKEHARRQNAEISWDDNPRCARTRADTYAMHHRA